MSQKDQCVSVWSQFNLNCRGQTNNDSTKMNSTFHILQISKYLRMVIQHEPCTKYGNQMKRKRRKRKQQQQKMELNARSTNKWKRRNSFHVASCHTPYAIRINRSNVQFVYGGNLVFVRSFHFFFFRFRIIFHHVVDANSFSTRYVFPIMFNVQWCLLCSISWKWWYTCSIFFFRLIFRS